MKVSQEVSRGGTIGQTIRLQVEFTESGIDPSSIQLFDPYQIQDVNIYTVSSGGTPIATITPVQISTGIYQVEWTPPTSLDYGTYYDEWKWVSVFGKSVRTQRYSFSLISPPESIAVTELITDNLEKRPEPTIPDDETDPPRFGQIIETTKDAFVIELKKFFDRNRISNSRLREIPTIKKFDFSFKRNESSYETAVKIIRKMPDIDENLPLVAILAATGRNLPMGIGGQLVAPVSARTYVQGSQIEPFALEDNQTLIYQTTTPQKETLTSVIMFRGHRFDNIAVATAQEVVDEINFQALYARASIGEGGRINLAYGGPATSPLPNGITGDIEIGDEDNDAGTAAATLGFVAGQKSEYTATTPFNRYHQAMSLDIAIEVVSEDENVRTELVDLVWAFFTFYMDERDYMFLGRSIFDSSIPNETYQVIIKPDPSMAGENEVPRPGDERDKLYVNRLNISVTTLWYTDRAVVSSNGTPFYLDADGVQYDGTIPGKN